MFELIKIIFSLRDNASKNQNTNKNPTAFNYENIKISHLLNNNRDIIKLIFNNCSDLIIREVKITNNPNISAMLVYIDNMVTTEIVEETIIKKLIYKNENFTYNPGSLEYSKYLLGINNKYIYTDMKMVVDSILSGNVLLFINGLSQALVINVKNPPSRNIEEPDVESVIRGPREGFTESLSTNVALIRKRIKSTHLKIEPFILGRETKTNIKIAYLSNIANPKIVNEVKERLTKIDIHAVLGLNYIKEYIEDEPLSNFPTIFSTEKPDVAAGKILEGRVAILTDGTPLAITVPAIFMEFLTTSEDYYLKFIAATINRWIRYISFIFSLTLPGAYVAITTFHQELIPTPLLSSFVKARSGIPFPGLMECILMLFVYEILREAGVRMPRAVGQAVSVVGALVLGQAAVEAGIASTATVIVVSLTAIASFTTPVPDMYEAVRPIRFIFTLLGGSLGLLGLICGILMLFMRLISLRSFGIPYLEPLAPFISSELPDVFMRRPIWAKFKRPWFITGKQSIQAKQTNHLEAINKEKDNTSQDN
ncbi:MAG: spore germination protein [Bacillota bacterium]|nr:spore germination protein [Bacillota bacterium]